MSVELLQTVSTFSYVGAVLLLLIGTALFFLLDIPKIYGYISGRTARKAIENIRQQNESSGGKAYKSSAVNEARGKLTEKMPPYGNTVLLPYADGSLEEKDSGVFTLEVEMSFMGSGEIIE